MLTPRDELLRLLVSGDARLIDAGAEGETTVVSFDVWDTNVSEELVIATFQGDHSAILREVLGGNVSRLEHHAADAGRAPETATVDEAWTIRLNTWAEDVGARSHLLHLPGRLLRLEIVPKRVAVLRVVVCPDECLARDGVAVLVQDLSDGSRHWTRDFVENLGDPRTGLSLDMVRCNYRGSRNVMPEEGECPLEEQHPLRAGCPVARGDTEARFSIHPPERPRKNRADPERTQSRPSRRPLRTPFGRPASRPYRECSNSSHTLRGREKSSGPGTDAEQTFQMASQIALWTAGKPAVPRVLEDSHTLSGMPSSRLRRLGVPRSLDRGQAPRPRASPR